MDIYRTEEEKLVDGLARRYIEGFDDNSFDIVLKDILYGEYQGQSIDLAVLDNENQVLETVWVEDGSVRDSRLEFDRLFRDHFDGWDHFSSEKSVSQVSKNVLDSEPLVGNRYFEDIDEEFRGFLDRKSSDMFPYSVFSDFYDDISSENLSYVD